MKKTKILAFVLIVSLILASAAFLACEKKEDENTLGSGKTSFKVEVVSKEGETKTFTIKTDEKMLVDALLHDDVKLIALGDYDMVVTVDKITADFEVDESWWKIMVNGKDAAVGVLEIEVEKDAVYAFKYEIGMGEWEE
jgi:hypothetical protein